MSYDLKKALGTVSKSPQPFSIYEGPKGTTLVIPSTHNITDVEAICGKGKVVASGKCSKNDEGAISLKTKAPPQKKWTDGLKKAFAAAGCASTHFEIEEAGESDASESDQEGSGDTPQMPQAPTPQTQTNRTRSDAIGENEDIPTPTPTGRGRAFAVSEGTKTPQPQPPTPEGTWQKTKPSAEVPRGQMPTNPPPRSGGGTSATQGAPTPKSPTSPTPPTRPGASSPKPLASDQQLETKAQEHLALRKGMKAVLTSVLQTYTGESAKMDDCMAKATQKTEEMRGNRNNTSALLVAQSVVGNYVDQAETIMAEVQKEWDGRTAGGGDMMRARGDCSTLPTSWSEDQKKTYARESNEAFGAYDKVQRQVQKVLGDMQAKIQEIKAVAEEAESLSGQAQDPRVYVERLTELNQQVEDAAKYFSLKLAKLDGTMAKQKGWSESASLTEQEGKTVRQMYDLEIAAQDNVNSKTQQFDVAVKRVAKIPEEARSNAGVAAALKKFEETVVKLSRDIINVKEQQKLSLQYLDTAIKKLS